MSGLTLFYVVFFYVALTVFIAGFMYKVGKYALTPAPLKIPLTPAPTSGGGVVARMTGEVTFFRSLFRSNKVIWLAGYLFHIGLLLVLIKHLRFVYPATPGFINTITSIEFYPGYIMLAGVLYLFVLRLAIDRHRFISLATDYFILILLAGIALTGVLSKLSVRPAVPRIKEFAMGVVTFRPTDMPTDTLFIVHLTLVLLLLIYFPFSKLMHAGGLFFSPTRNQIDNPRERRHVAPWALKESSGAVGGAAQEAPEAAN